ATVNTDGKVMMPSGGFPSWGYGFAGMYDSGGYIPRGQFGIVGENGPEIVNGPANVTSRRNTAALAAVVAGMMGGADAYAGSSPSLEALKGVMDKNGPVSNETLKAKLPENVTHLQTVITDSRVISSPGDYPSPRYVYAGMYNNGDYIPHGQFGIVGENGSEIVNGPANVTSRRNTAALAAVVAGMMGVA
ncbi:hypothetical protein SNC25_00050, partial [Escherichia coli]|nr:hypothetical protein [Escherichia coli]